MCEPKFYRCKDTGAIALLLSGKECGSLQPLTANTSEGAREKHLPVVTEEEGGVRVSVGSVAHPMSEEHSIEWVYLSTTCGGQLHGLSGQPETVFTVGKEERPCAVYAYCNLHGLWKTELDSRDAE